MMRTDRIAAVVSVPAFALLAGLVAAPAQAQPIPDVNDGQALRRECRTAIDVADNGPEPSDDDLERGSDMGQCLGLVSGVWHTHMMMVDELGSPPAFCPTESLSSGQMARIVDAYLTRYPSDLSEWDTVVVLRAFAKAFPCG